MTDATFLGLRQTDVLLGLRAGTEKKFPTGIVPDQRTFLRRNSDISAPKARKICGQNSWDRD